LTISVNVAKPFSSKGSKGSKGSRARKVQGSKAQNSLERLNFKKG